MKPADFAREFGYPMTDVSVMLGIGFFFVAIEFAALGGLIGLFLIALVLPALFRYLSQILASRARNQEPGPLAIEHFLWFENFWSVFPAVHFAVSIYSVYLLGSIGGLAGLVAALTLLAVVLPASLAILAITRSPVECLRPSTIAGLIRRCGPAYWVLPTYFLAATLLVLLLSNTPLPEIVREWIAFYLLFALFSLTGGVVQPQQLHREVGIHEPAEPDQESVDKELLKERTAVLNHAYGFISRDNRAGGFKHIHEWLAHDPDPDAAWEWFFEQMLRWENSHPALLFAQTYLSRLLYANDRTAAVKIIMRCRLIDAAFNPLPEDRELAREAAESCQNQDLARTLL